MPLPVAGGFIAALIAVGSTYAIPWLIRVIMTVLGLSVITMIGLDVLFDYGIEVVRDRYAGLPSNLLDWLDFLGAFDALEILIGAINGALALKWLCGMAEGAGKRKKIDFSC